MARRWFLVPVIEVRILEGERECGLLGNRIGSRIGLVCNHSKLPLPHDAPALPRDIVQVSGYLVVAQLGQSARFGFEKS